MLARDREQACTGTQSLTPDRLQILRPFVGHLRDAVVLRDLEGLAAGFVDDGLDSAVGVAQFFPDVLGVFDFGEVVSQLRRVVGVLGAEPTHQVFVGIFQLALRRGSVERCASEALVGSLHFVAGSGTFVGVRAGSQYCQNQ